MKPKINMYRGQWFVAQGWWIGQKAATIREAWALWVQLIDKRNTK